MSYNRALDLLQNTILEVELPYSPLMDGLDKEEPIIYLCGTSDAGKTTFLSALLNRKKGELFMGTGISTKTEFRFIYGDEQMYQVNDDEKQPLPITSIERKELFTQLNQEGANYTIELTEKALKGRTIVDIPGILDYTSNKNHIRKMLNEADIVWFFTPCNDRVNAQEYELLKELTDADIPTVFLFTMSDMTDPDEGITRKTLPEYVQNRINNNLSEIKIASHFIVSASDFYKGKDSHGIDTFLSHIQSNEIRYFNNAKISRLKRLFKFYIEYLEKEIGTLKQDAKQVVSLIKRENELWYEDEKNKIKNENDSATRAISHELEGLIKQCKSQLLGCFLNPTTYEDEMVSMEDKRESFASVWNDFWKNLKEKYNETLTTLPLLPPMPSSLFKTIKIDTEKIKDLFETIISGDDEDDKSESIKEKIKLEDIIQIGINLNNAVILFEHWKYFETVAEEIKVTEEVLLLNLANVLKLQESDLSKVSQKKIKDALEEDNTIQKLESYQSAISKLKKVSNYAQ